MANTYDLYGFSEPRIEAAKAAFEAAVGIGMAPHESLFLGNYFRCRGNENEEFELRENFNAFDEDWTKTEFKEFPVLLFVNRSGRCDELKEGLCRNGFAFLNRSVI